jgi:hypothetical protein
MRRSDVVSSEWYRRLWPDVVLVRDNEMDGDVGPVGSPSDRESLGPIAAISPFFTRIGNRRNFQRPVSGRRA